VVDGRQRKREREREREMYLEAMCKVDVGVGERRTVFWQLLESNDDGIGGCFWPGATLHDRASNAVVVEWRCCIS
jgi:hypothetical protein